jgi:hypothetical protein
VFGKRGSSAQDGASTPSSFCAAEQQPSAECAEIAYGAPSNVEWKCSGDDSVQCWDGYVTARTSCNGDGRQVSTGLCPPSS